MIKYLSNHKVILKGSNKINDSEVHVHMQPDTNAPKGAKGFYNFAIYVNSYKGLMPVSNDNKGLIIAVFDKSGKKINDYDLNFNMYKVSKSEYLDLAYALKLINDNLAKIVKHELH